MPLTDRVGACNLHPIPLLLSLGEGYRRRVYEAVLEQVHAEEEPPPAPIPIRWLVVRRLREREGPAHQLVGRVRRQWQHLGIEGGLRTGQPIQLLFLPVIWPVAIVQ